MNSEDDEKKSDLASSSCGGGEESKESDVTDAGEISDFWDQENYLSEHYYEEKLDEDTAHRLINFGDDYRNFLDSLSDGPAKQDDEEEAVSPSRNRRRSKKSTRNGTIHDGNSLRKLEGQGLLSKYEWRRQDIEKTVAEVVGRLTCEDTATVLEKLLTLTKDNTSCLNMILSSIGKKPYYSEAYIQVKDCLKKWKRLKAILQLLLEISLLYKEAKGNLRRISDQKISNDEISRTDSEMEVEPIKSSLADLTASKSDLLDLNVGVHMLQSQFGHRNGDLAAVQTTKDEMVQLYEEWHSIFHRFHFNWASHPQHSTSHNEEEVSKDHLAPIGEQTKSQSAGQDSKKKPGLRRRNKSPERRRKKKIPKTGLTRSRWPTDLRSRSRALCVFLLLLHGVFLLIWTFVSVYQPLCCENSVVESNSGFFTHFGYEHGSPPI